MACTEPGLPGTPPAPVRLGHLSVCQRRVQAAGSSSETPRPHAPQRPSAPATPRGNGTQPGSHQKGRGWGAPRAAPREKPRNPICSCSSLRALCSRLCSIPLPVTLLKQGPKRSPPQGRTHLLGKKLWGPGRHPVEDTGSSPATWRGLQCIREGWEEDVVRHWPCHSSREQPPGGQ